MHTRLKRTFTAALAVLLMISMLSSCLIRKIEQPDKPETAEPAPGFPETDAPETDAPETDAPETDPPETEPKTEPETARADFSLDDLRSQNLISSLLGRHEVVNIRKQYDAGSETESFWLKNGDRVMYDISDAEYEGGESYHSEAGSYRGIDFYVKPPDWTTATKWVTAEPGVYDGWIDTRITDYLPERLTEDIILLGEEGDIYTVLLKEALTMEGGIVAECDNTISVDKGTLDIRSFRWEYEMDGVLYYGMFEVEYDGEKYGSEALAEWDETRTVRLDILTEAGGERTEEFQYPVRWQLALIPDEGITLSSPDAEEDEGVIRIPAQSGDVTVYARDEANALSIGGGEPQTLDELPFTLETLQEKNRITNLLNEYGTIVAAFESEFGAYTTSYFRNYDDIVEFSEGEVEGENGETVKVGYGTYKRYHLELTADGMMTIYGELPPEEGENIFYDTNADGEHYDHDLTLTESLFLGEVRDIVREGDTVTFRYVYDFGDGDTLSATVAADASTALLHSIVWEETGESFVLYPAKAVPFAETFGRAYQTTRKILCHFTGAGDCTYEVPAEWQFKVGYLEPVLLFSDAGMKDEIGSVLPGDAGEYEIWGRDVTEAVQYLAADFAGNWRTESGGTALTVYREGGFVYSDSADVYEGTLVWTTEERGLWMSGPRYELILEDGSVLHGDAAVFWDDLTGRLTLGMGGGAEYLSESSVITARYAEDAAAYPDALQFKAASGDHTAQVLLTAERAVKDFTFYSLEYVSTLEDGRPVFSTVDLYKLADMKPDKSLLVTLTFGELYPAYGFTYKDADGTERDFGLIQSGRDGSILVTEIAVPKG